MKLSLEKSSKHGCWVLQLRMFFVANKINIRRDIFCNAVFFGKNFKLRKRFRLSVKLLLGSRKMRQVNMKVFKFPYQLSQGIIVRMRQKISQQGIVSNVERDS